MSNLLETIATSILLILLALLFIHLMEGTATDWLLSKFKAEDTSKT